MQQDVIVIGGGYAGMSAALQLLRARRQVTVIDAGQRRNRFAATSHGFLGQDGADPAALADSARAQLAQYDTLTWLEAVVTGVEGAFDGFTATCDSGQTVTAKRLLIATGVADALPDIPGLAERWGRSVFHCPYCHGYELNMGQIGVIATGPNSVHQALILPDWGQVTLLTNGALDPDAETLAALDQRGVAVEATPIEAIDGTAEVRLADGRVLGFAGLFTAPVCAPVGDIGAQLGCEVMDTPLGTQLRTDDQKQTSQPGVFACGDVARAPHSVALAVGDGAWAGACVHRSLLFPPG